MKMTPEMRARFIADSKGKTIADVEWVDDDKDWLGGYWAIEFTSGEELCVRLMVETHERPPR